MKSLITISAILLFSIVLIGVPTKGNCQAKSDYEYAYIVVSGKIFSKKLNVEVDFGDEPDQIKKGEQYSMALTGKKSYIAVINYMVKEGYEPFETLEFNYTYQGTGGTSGLGMIFRRKIE